MSTSRARAVDGKARGKSAYCGNVFVPGFVPRIGESNLTLPAPEWLQIRAFWENLTRSGRFAMQKVVGSSPIIRSQGTPWKRAGFFFRLSDGRLGEGSKVSF